MKHKILLGLVSSFVLITGLLLFTTAHTTAEVANDVSTGLELQWKMNESPGNFFLNDTSSNNNTGTLYNTDVNTSRSSDVPYSSGANSHSLLLNGTDTNDYATSNSDIPDAVASTMPRTLCGWVKLSTTSGVQVAFNYGSQSVGGKFGIYASGGHWWFWGFGSADLETSANTDTNWHNHCVSYDSAVVTYYFDGVEVGSASRSLDTTVSTRLTIGQRDANDISQPFFGKVDDIRIYSRPLSQAEINEVANVQSVAIDSHPANPSNQNVATFEFSSSGNPVSTTCQIDNGPATVCVSPYASMALSEGPHTFTVRATDGGNNTVTDSYAWTVDLTPADTFITRLGSDVVQSYTTDFIVTSNEPATFECNLDNGGYSSCDNAYTTPELDDGEHTLSVRATDAAGNTDPTPAVHTWNVDTSAVDTDQDSVYDVIESAGPNGGDANNDGTPDAQQADVASFQNPLTGDYQVLTTDCDSVSAIQTGSEAGGESADPTYDYPMGLTEFHSVATHDGVTCHFEQYFYGVSSNADFVFRKWDGAYQTVEGAQFDSVPIAGETVLRVSYDVTDGGNYDSDGEANGMIVDPAGVAQPLKTASSSATLSKTGQIVSFICLAIASAICVTAILTKYCRHQLNHS